MKSKNHHKYIIAGFVLATVFLLSQLIQPKQCQQNETEQNAGYVALAHISEPAKTAVLSVLSLQMYPNCYAPSARTIEEGAGKWPPHIAAALSQKSYTAYRHWNTFFANCAALICIYVAVAGIKKYYKDKDCETQD